MQINIEEIWQQFNLLSQREKLMISGALLLLVLGSWDGFFYQEWSQENQTLESEIASLQSQLAAKQQATIDLAALAQKSVIIDPHKQLNDLQQSINQLKKQFDVGDKKFVPAESMAKALSDILQQQGNLKLVKLETLPVTAFPDKEDKEPWLFRHTLVLTMQGDFFSTLSYMKTLENLPWRIHWDSINYQVKGYPIAETRIQVYTLSFEKDWLGV